MALTKISASVIAANAIVAAGVAENSISTSEIATDGVGTLQISDGAVTSGKLETNVDIAGTLDVTGVLTADSNVVIAGNLTVNGATVTNSSTNTTIADALIELGTGTTGSPANDAGIVIERGDSDNAFIGWDESADTFILGTGSFTGASTGNLTISTAPLSVGTLTASGITYPTSDGSSGQVLKTDGSGNLTFDAQTAVVDNFTATGDGSTTDFDTGINPGDEVNTWVFIDGVYQQKGEYSYSGSTISFSTAPDSGATIDVTTGTVGGFASADSVLGVYETTTTNTDTYTTGISASNENNTWVFVGGVYQPKDSYTFSSGTLTFDANTPTGQKLSVTATKSLSAGSVETNSITANAVTSAKIASNSILSRHIANNSIVGADISATTQITASTFTGALTGDVTGNVVGNLTGTIQTAAQTNITSVGSLTALDVAGTVTADGLVIDGDTINFNTSAGDLDIQALGGSSNQIEGSGSIKIKAAGGSVDLINGTTEVLSTTSTGINVTGAVNSTGEMRITNPSATSQLYLYGATGQKANIILNEYGVRAWHVGAGTYTSGKFSISDGSTERLVIDASGNVGIGTSGPQRPLDVVGGAIFANGSAAHEILFGDYNYRYFKLYTPASPDYMTIRTGSTDLLTVAADGFVGIGTTTPTSISGAAGPVLRMTGSNPEIVFDDNNGTANQVSMYYLNNLLVWHSPQKTGGAGTVLSLATTSGNLSIVGALSKGSGSFKIDHPLESKTDTHHLIHSFVEAPQADNIYRGKVDLVNGSATVNIDTVAGMTEGTFVALNREVQCFTTNESNWDAVKGSVSGNILTIESQNSESTATISWLVIGERQDQHMYDTDWTDENGKVIVEPLKETETQENA